MAKAYLIQTVAEATSKERSFEKVRGLVESAHLKQGSLIIFPEMFTTGFLTAPEKDSGEILVPSKASALSRFLQELADRTDCTVLGGGIEKFGNSFRNATGAYFPKKKTPEAIYRKRHLFAEEASHFEPGEDFAHFEWAGFSIYPFICFDLRFPEDFRHARASGATLITVQAEWPHSRSLAWETLLRARAIENQCFILAVNRAGDDFGGSCAFGPSGEMLLGTSAREGIYEVSIDPSDVEAARKAFPIPPPIL
ncbi:MAG: hypothetical protein M0P13_03650 [Fibrobacteraceae bacterium]|nr:hypothetical protein [Fibrobacteraceae bacterium]